VTDDLFSVRDEIVLITGASGQLGISYQKAFLERGALVVGLDIVKGADIKSLQALYEDTYMYIPADVTSKDSLEAALKNIRRVFGRPTVLINNAAIDSPPDASGDETGPFESYPEESWDKVIDVNLKGTFLACQVFGAAMAAGSKGSIINVASIYGVVSPDQSLYDYRRVSGEVFYKPVAYCASKSGILNLTRYLSVYWAKENVRVNTLTIAGVFNGQDEEFLEAYSSRIPVGRMASSNQYDASLIFLASNASSYMTGSNLIVDGGWTAI
jgi:NAD(P)-dependent dehydrogenase (short-subunit alcohol dehydrogenase family)